MTKENTDQLVERLEKFQLTIQSMGRIYEITPEKRSEIIRESVWVRRQVLEHRCLKTFIVGPPPAVGGLVMDNVDLFSCIFDPPYGMNVIRPICDMIDKTIANIKDPPPMPTPRLEPAQSTIRVGYAFVAMAIDTSDGGLVDTLDAIKDACKRCGIQAERIDEDQSNDRITDRILSSIDAAEYIIADLTLERPNVFYEAGYALGKGKIPIYIARAGTKLHFDLKDYPVIFFNTYKQLKDELERRIRGLAEKNSS